VTARLAFDFPLPDTYRTKTSFRHLLAGQPNLPKRWNQPSKPGAPLIPIDQLASILLNLQNVINPEADPATPFLITKRNIIDACLFRWQATYPTPQYYNLPHTLQPHLFMQLDKFISGRLHQFRAQKSYLAAHQSWMNTRLSTRCPRCYEDEEDLHHALLACPSRLRARDEFIPELKSVDDIWTSFPTTLQVEQYLYATKTGFPPEFSGWFPSSPSAVSDILSEVDSVSSSIFLLPN
jgi:hypothetical protein